MAQKSAAQLTTENNNTITSKTAIESIGPNDIGGIVNQDFIDSFWNKTDSPFTLPPTTLTKSQIATLAAGNLLIDKQWILVSNASLPLYIQCQGASLIAPYGIQIKAGKPLHVIMDYLAGYDGDTFPFLQIIDDNHDLTFTGRFANFIASSGVKIGSTGTPVKNVIVLQTTFTTAYGSIASGDGSDTAGFALSGAVLGDVVDLGIPAAAMPSGGGNALTYQGYVSSANVIKIRAVNGSGGSITPPVATFNIRIIKYTL